MHPSENNMPVTSWKMSYPEQFMAWLDKRPHIEHDAALRQIISDEAFVRSVFRYEKLEEGCYLFMVDISARRDTLYRLSGDTGTEYYCLSYQVTSGPVQRRPEKAQRHEDALSMPRVCSFYNNHYNYDVRFPQGARARSALFCFTREWLEKSLDLQRLGEESDFVKVLNKSIDCVVFINNHYYNNTLDELIRVVSGNSQDPLYRLEIKKLSFTLIYGLFRLLYHIPEESPAGAARTVVETVQQYLNEHYREGFPGLARLAALAHTTVPTLQRYFRKQTGRSAFNYFQELQMAYACERLTRGDSVKDIAYTLGYASPGNFTRVFKKQYHIAPTQLQASPAADHK